MWLKFYTLATSLSILAGPAAFGQTQSTPAPKAGYIRFWDMLPAATGNFQLRKAGKPGDVLATASAYRYSSYVELPIGQYQLSVVRSGTDTPLKNITVDIKADTYFTVILAPRGSGLNVEFLDDTIDPKITSGTLTIRNYFPGTSVSVISGNQILTPGLSYGASYAARGLAVSRTPVTIQTKLPNGTSAQLTVDLDFSASKSLTLLVIPDSYGRFRPRIVADGCNL
jgi:hypothetical protein